MTAYCCMTMAMFVTAPARAQQGVDPTELSFELDSPIKTTLRIEGRKTPMRGRIRAWSFGSFWVVRDGGQTPVRVDWDEIQPRIAFETMRRIIDRDDSVRYFQLGIEMLVLDDQPLAERAFRYATRLEESLIPDTEAAMAMWNAGDDPRVAFSEMQTRIGADAVETEKTGVRATEETAYQAPVAFGGWGQPDESQAKEGVEPWVPLGIEERERAIKVQREYAATAGHGPGDSTRRIYETDHFIMATDLNEAEMIRWGDKLEVMYDTMIEMFLLPEDTDLYAGKCNVFVFGDRASYIKFEKRAMGFNARGTGGVCHYRGEDVVIAFYRWGSDAEFQSVLIHESVHGLLYRYRTPARIPTWVNEGLADYIAGHLTPQAIRPREQWTLARNFINQKKNPHGVIESFYGTGDRTVHESYALSHMLVRFLIKYRGPEFKLWIDDMKAGAHWEVSMRTRFGIDSRKLAQGFTEEIKSEKRYSR